MSKPTNQAIGAAGEALAAAHLQQHGYTLLERNYRAKGGEVDIIALDRAGCIVFVEVKTRRSLAYGPPQLAVTLHKQRQISKGALTWLARHRRHDSAARFDVIAVLLHDAGTHELEHITNAFELGY